LPSPPRRPSSLRESVRATSARDALAAGIIRPRQGQIRPGSHPGRFDWMGTTFPVARSRLCRTSRMRNSASSPRPSSIARAAASTSSASVILDTPVTNGGLPDAKGREPVSIGVLSNRAPLDDAAEFSGSVAFSANAFESRPPRLEELVFSQIGARGFATGKTLAKLPKGSSRAGGRAGKDPPNVDKEAVRARRVRKPKMRAYR
jgi:hypothetical protein